MNNSDIEHRFTDRNHPPVPQLKVGDICYASCQWGSRDHYDYISTCEVRKVEVFWHEEEEYWYVKYYIRADIDDQYLKSTKMYSYYLVGEGARCGGFPIYRTPQEVMDDNIREFKERVFNQLASMRGTMRKLGYSEEQMSKLLENK